MKKTLENTENLSLLQAEIVDIDKDENGCVCGVVSSLGVYYSCKAAVICSGTYLKGKVIVGNVAIQSGPDAQLPANSLSEI